VSSDGHQGLGPVRRRRSVPVRSSIDEQPGKDLGKTDAPESARCFALMPSIR